MFALATLMQGYNIKLSPLDALLCVREKKHYIEVTRYKYGGRIIISWGGEPYFEQNFGVIGYINFFMCW